MPLVKADLNKAVNDAVLQSAPLAEARGLVLKAETANEPTVASANEAGVRRLLLILIDNALKHTPAGGTITVSSAARDGEVVLSVQDTGEGIPAGSQAHIFERFYRAGTTRGGGSGLGLSIAQAIAQAHGSMITVESTPGAGARFSLTLKS
jgi:signal transduction histidine kinase